MSRSRKKEPVRKDSSNTKGKALANRRLRRSVKQAIHKEEENMPLLDEVMNVYDLIDYRERAKIDVDGEEYYKKMLRK